VQSNTERRATAQTHEQRSHQANAQDGRTPIGPMQAGQKGKGEARIRSRARASTCQRPRRRVSAGWRFRKPDGANREKPGYCRAPRRRVGACCARKLPDGRRWQPVARRQQHACPQGQGESPQKLSTRSPIRAFGGQQPRSPRAKPERTEQHNARVARSRPARRVLSRVAAPPTGRRGRPDQWPRTPTGKGRMH